MDQAAACNWTTGEKVGDVTIKVFKFGSISGVVTDDIGEPVVGASVRLYRRNLVAGRRVLSQVNGTTTDDRGVYRLSSLLAGDYYVMLPVVPSSSPRSVVGRRRCAHERGRHPPET
jgi:hypothetical protein